MEDYSEEHFIVKISGMPYTATCEDVAKFLAGLDIKGGRKNGVHVTRDESGRASGECFVELTCEEDVEAALRKDKQHMGKRWVNVTKVTHDAMMSDINKCEEIQQKLDERGEFIVKVRGLPWSSQAEDIENFFSGCQLSGSKETSIKLLRNSMGRLTGQALVEFADGESLNLALSKNKQHMGSRYLEVNRSDKSEMDRLTEKSDTVSKNRDPIVMCRGLPFSATEEDVKNFFSGLQIVEIQMVYDADGIRPMGKCFVQFNSLSDSEAALNKFGEKMGSRYIEIFQSNWKFWYAQEGVPHTGPSHARPGTDPRPRHRPQPYSKPPPRGGAAGFNTMPRGGRVKHISHDRRNPYGGYDGSDGYQAQEYSAVGAAGGARAPGAPNKHIVVVKGVSMDVSMGDVIKFFTDNNTPKNVEMKFGEAVVEFHTHGDAMRAMLKDKTVLAGVKVNLELQSKPEDYVGYSEPHVVEDPYQDYSSYSDPYSQNKPYQAQGGYNSYRW